MFKFKRSLLLFAVVAVFIVLAGLPESPFLILKNLHRRALSQTQLTLPSSKLSAKLGVSSCQNLESLYSTSASLNLAKSGLSTFKARLAKEYTLGSKSFKDLASKVLTEKIDITAVTNTCLVPLDISTDLKLGTDISNLKLLDVSLGSESVLCSDGKAHLISNSKFFPITASLESYAKHIKSKKLIFELQKQLATLKFKKARTASSKIEEKEALEKSIRKVNLSLAYAQYFSKDGLLLGAFFDALCGQAAAVATPQANATPIVITKTPSSTPTRVATWTVVPVITNTPARTATTIPTITRTPTGTASRTPTLVPTNTRTTIATFTRTSVPTSTRTSVPTFTNTATSIPTRIVTNTPTRTATSTSTSVPTFTRTATSTPTKVATSTPILTATPTAVSGTGSMLLSVDPSNPRYFRNANGKTVYLTGHHTWSNGLSVFDYSAYLDSYTRANLNFVARIWRQENWFSAYGTAPFNKKNGKWDLMSFNQAYFDLIRNRVIQARAKGLYVGIMLFEGWWVHEEPEGWVDSIWNGNNNANWGSSEVTISDMHTLNKKVYVDAQKAYAEKMLSTLNDLDNIVIEIGNEMNANSQAFAEEMVKFVKNWEAQPGRVKHLVGVSSSGGGAGASPGVSNSYMLNSTSADWIALGQRENLDLLTNPAVYNAPKSKPNFADTDHIDPVLNSTTWPWKVFMRGHNPILMDEWADGDDGSTPAKLESARRAMGQTKKMADKINLAKIIPSNSIADCSTGYCLKNVSDGEYVALNLSVASTSIKIDAAGNYSYNIYDPQSMDTVRASGTFTATAGMTKSFATVSGLSQGMVVHVKRN